MSLNRLYELSRRSLQTQTARMSVAGQNIANADTPGYARRRLDLHAEGPLAHGVIMRPASPTGNGVLVGGYERLRDTLLLAAGREAEAGFGRAGEEARLLGALEGVFGQNGTALPDAMGGFWRAWSDLADHPADPGVRSAVLHHAGHVAHELNRTSRDLARFATEAERDLGTAVGQANKLLGEIGALNLQIHAARASGAADHSAEDRRDQALQELSAFLPISAGEGPDGFHVTSGGMRLVQGQHVQPLRLTPSSATEPAAVTVGDTGKGLPADGRLGGFLRTLNTTLPGLRADLDAFAADLVAGVNALHEEGFGLDGGTGRAFFDPEGTTASTLAVALTDPRHLAASADGAPGNNAVALRLLDLREGLDARAAAMAQGVGGRLRTARAEATAHGAMADHLAAMERGVSGVSLDEEMTRLIEAQQSFAAAARVLTTAEEMMETLLRL